MAKDPKELMAMSDDDLRFYTLSGEEGSYAHQIGQTEMNMRCALRISQAAAQMASANTDLAEATRRVVEGHHGLIRQTRNLVKATWGIVVITLGLIVSEVIRK